MKTTTPWRPLMLLIVLALRAITSAPAAAQTLPTGFRTATLSAGWSEPVGLAFTGQADQMLVWERPGKVWAVTNGQRQVLLDLTAEVGGWNDHGLLGLALDPQFASNGYFYLLYVVDRHHLLNFGTGNYNPAANDYYSATVGRLTRYTAVAGAGGSLAVVPNSRRVLLGATASTGIPSTASGHVACALAFGTDGSLLVGTGDGAHPYQDTGSSPDSFFDQALTDGIIRPTENVGSFRAQQVNSLSGKILRLDPATGLGLPTNPFYDAAAPDAPRSKVWALGCRNPFRMALKPETGSHRLADGNPGTLYVADVGYNNWEEVTAVDGPGQNLGWPLYEGLTVQNTFMFSRTANPEAPNPGFGIGTSTCTQAFFNFQDLLQQAAATPPPPLASPCGGPLPASVRQFVHRRPLLDYGHPSTGPVRTGTFDGPGGAAGTVAVGALGSPLAGPGFGGSAVVGGVFYPHHDFPAAYHNAFFMADYTTGWIKALAVDTTDAPTAQVPLVPGGSVPVGLAVHPTLGGLYYANFYPGEIRKVSYFNPNPTALATADRRYGPAPLAVQFTGSASASADGSALTFAWAFGDGTASTQPNPQHTFTPPGPGPRGYTTTLTVTDGAGRTAADTVLVSVNNTPPQVRIISPVPGTRYPVTGLTAFSLQATVSDAEHGPAQLHYAWQTWLHHNTHAHPEPVDTARQSSLTTSPLGCGTDTYYYRIRLTVTDAAGLAAFDEVRLDPACAPASQAVSTFTLVNADTDFDIQPLTAGSVLNLSTLPTRNLNIRANTSPAAVGSVVFALSGAASRTGTESVLPYALFSDSNGDYAPWTPPLGSYTLLATPYTGGGGSGTAGTPLSINFTVIDPGAGTPTSTFTLVNADTDLDIQALPSGSVLNLAALPTRNLNVRANPVPGGVGSVVFALAGAASRSHTESVVPYALFSDSNGDYNPWTPPLGSYTLQATPYTGGGGSGAAGTPFSISFSVIDQTSTGQFTLTTSVTGSGTVARLPAQATYAAGATVQLTALPAAGFQFAGWGGDTTASTNPLPLVMRRNRSLVASFVPQPQSVTSFTLVNADTDLDIQPLPSGSTVNLRALPTRNINIRANTSPTAVGSVVFALAGATTRNHTESVVPYALFSDSNGDYAPWTPPLGSYTLQATPYTGGGGSGTAGTPFSISFAVTDTPTNSGTGLTARLSMEAVPNPSPDARYRLLLSAPIQGEWHYQLRSDMGRELARGTRKLLLPTQELSFDFGPVLPAEGLAHLLLYPTTGTAQQAVRLRLTR